MSRFIWKYKSVTILGGTGTLGQELTRQISQTFPDVRITILSRDEHKQASMMKLYPNCRYVVGDICDKVSIAPFLDKVDAVFHVAALKHVDIMERNVRQCFRTNVEGSVNAMDLSYSGDCRYFVFSSTDKAVDPINAYGYAKGMAEKYLYDFNYRQSHTKFSCYRWGNVLGSTGSAIPYFIKSLKENGSVSITDRRMTRFWIPIEWAVTYMLYTFMDAHPDRAMIPPTMKAATLMRVVSIIAHLLDIKLYTVNDIGLRAGEKLHEAMTSQWSDRFLDSSNAEQYTDYELIEMLKPIVEKFK